MVTKAIMLIHVFRTGGYMVQGVLRKVPGLVMVSDRPTEHLTYDQMAVVCARERMGNPPAMVFIRNPFDWYVSMWCWVNMAPNMPPVSEFREYLEVIRVRRYGTTGTGRNYSRLSEHWADMGAGKAQWEGRFETLREDFMDIMLKVMPSLVNEKMLGDLMAKEPIYHPSRHPQTGRHPGDYRQYYTPETRALVEEWDSELLERFGYTFEEKVDDIPNPGA